MECHIYSIKNLLLPFLSEMEKNKELVVEPIENGGSKTGLTSLDGLPSLTPGSGSGMGSLAGAPPLGRPKSPEGEFSCIICK